MVKLGPCYLLLAAQVVAITLPVVSSKPIGEHEHQQNEPEHQTAPPVSTSPMDENDLNSLEVEASKSETPNQVEDRPKFHCQELNCAVKKILSPVDHLSDLDHRDYVVSDREFEIVLRRLNSGELPLGADSSESSQAQDGTLQTGPLNELTPSETTGERNTDSI